jgi:hypothetical protein
MSDIDRYAAWTAPVIPTPMDVPVGPGYLCGLVLERFGTQLLYGTKISVVVGKCWFYTRQMQVYERVADNLMYTLDETTTTRLLKKQLTLDRLALIITEGADLLRHV